MNDEIKKTEPDDATLPAADIDRLTISEVRDFYANGQLRMGDILDAIGIKSVFTEDPVRRTWSADFVSVRGAP